MSDSADNEDMEHQESENSSYVITERDFVSMMIELYRNRPVLWKMKHPQYCDKVARSTAIDEIVQELRNYKADFDSNEFKRRINVIRTNFNKARAKPRPTLWYFNELLFLTELDNNEEDQETSIAEVNINDNSIETEQNGNEADEASDQEEKYRPTVQPVQNRPRIEVVPGSTRSLKRFLSVTPVKKLSSTTPRSQSSAPSTSKKVKNIEVTRKNVVLAGSENGEENKDSDLEQYMTITTTYYKKAKTDEDVLAETWASKLKKLTPTQKMYAEKIINDVLFQAELGNLTKNGVSFCTF